MKMKMKMKMKKWCIEKIVVCESNRIKIKVLADHIVISKKNGKRIFLTLDPVMHTDEEIESFDILRFMTNKR